MHHLIIKASSAYRLLCLLITAFIWQGANAQSQEITVQVNGQPYQVTLYPQDFRAAMDQPHAQQLRGQHYRGEIATAAGSWARLSQIEGQWQGMVSVHGELYVIEPDSHAGQQRASQQHSLPWARALSQLDHPGTCGVDHHHHQPSPSILASRSTHSALTLPSREDFDSALCQQQVDGVCLMPKIAVVFDAQFQQRYPENYQDQAAALMNIVDGYYRNDMRMTFNTLHLAFPQQELFTDSSDAGELLDRVRERYHQLDFIDTSSDRPLLHLISGRSFDGSTVGLAWVSTLCNPNGYATGITQIVNNIPVTALVFAHEIGHNFAGRHDQDNGCGGGFIMSSFVDASATQFSSCSQDEMLARTLNEANRDNCFDYPADAGISDRDSNPEAFTNDSGPQLALSYDIHYQQASRSPDRLVVSGQITSNSGRLNQASMDGGSCSLNAGQRSYQCTLDNPMADSAVHLTLAATSNDPVSLSQQVSLAGNQVIDIVPTNNRLDATFAMEIVSSQPQNLSATPSEQPLAITLNWTDLAPLANHYQVQRRQPQQTWQTLASLAGDAEHYQDNQVDTDTDYDYRVIADASDGEASNIVRARVESTPAAPAQLTSQVSQNQVQLQWQNQADFAIANRVERQRQQDNGQWSRWHDISGHLPPQTDTYVDSTGVAGSRYRYQIRTLNISKVSSPSNPVEAQLITPPEAPYELTSHLNKGQQGVMLTWQHDDSDLLGFTVERKTGEQSQWQTLATLNGNQSHYLDRLIEEGQQYDYRVYATNSLDNSPPSATTRIRIAISPPGAPELFQAQIIDHGIQLNWNHPGNVDHFLLQRQHNGGNWEPLVELAAKARDFLDSDIAAGNQYRYRIFARNQGGDSAMIGSPLLALHDHTDNDTGPTADSDQDSPGKTDDLKQGLNGGGGSVSWLLLALLLLPLRQLPRN